ncbi:hypothetical protein JD969_14555 [Planctomycetota bacterium]|nr:hypothetical protein JD969_14555 [Planctomycetota bacterium]
MKNITIKSPFTNPLLYIVLIALLTITFISLNKHTNHNDTFMQDWRSFINHCNDISFRDFYPGTKKPLGLQGNYSGSSTDTTTQKFIRSYEWNNDNLLNSNTLKPHTYEINISDCIQKFLPQDFDFASQQTNLSNIARLSHFSQEEKYIQFTDWNNEHADHYQSMTVDIKTTHNNIIRGCAILAQSKDKTKISFFIAFSSKLN